MCILTAVLVCYDQVIIRIAGMVQHVTGGLLCVATTGGLTTLRYPLCSNQHCLLLKQTTASVKGRTQDSSASTFPLLRVMNRLQGLFGQSGLVITCQEAFMTFLRTRKLQGGEGASSRQLFAGSSNRRFELAMDAVQRLGFRLRPSSIRREVQ